MMVLFLLRQISRFAVRYKITGQWTEIMNTQTKYFLPNSYLSLQISVKQCQFLRSILPIFSEPQNIRKTDVYCCTAVNVLLTYNSLSFRVYSYYDQRHELQLCNGSNGRQSFARYSTEFNVGQNICFPLYLKLILIYPSHVIRKPLSLGPIIKLFVYLRFNNCLGFWNSAMKDRLFRTTQRDAKESINTQAHTKKQQRAVSRLVLSSSNVKIFNRLSFLSILFLVFYFSFC